MNDRYRNFAYFYALLINIVIKLILNYVNKENKETTCYFFPHVIIME